MLIIGLTGSIAMGKSTAAKYLSKRGLPIFNADDVVHELYRGEAAGLIDEAFPGTVKEGVVDRNALSQKLIAAPHRIKELEGIIHPIVAVKRADFIEDQRAKGQKVIVLDIPLLFEKQLEATVDVTLLMTAPQNVQRERVLDRPGMTVEKLDMILSNQMPDQEKRSRADFAIDTSGPFEETHAKLDEFLESVQGWPQKAAIGGA